jgi:hypothetical protein
MENHLAANRINLDAIATALDALVQDFKSSGLQT